MPLQVSMRKAFLALGIIYFQLSFRFFAVGVKSGKKFRRVQVHVVHRHGDRSPITPMKDEAFWASTLIPEALLKKISAGTKVIRSEGHIQSHKAGGRGPFGKLSQLGLFQMIELGMRLREELSTLRLSEDQGSVDNEESSVFLTSRPLRPMDVRVISTDFPRTIQSVQGLLLGLYPDGTNDHEIEIDARHTSWLIPDPQPRHTEEQVQLEEELVNRPYMREREAEMRPLAVQVTEVLRPLLGEGAFDVSFGVGEDGKKIDHSTQPLPWAQLAEITNCLKVRELLPAAITDADQSRVMQHTAWMWFESLRHPRLIYLAMNKLATTITKAMMELDCHPPLTIYSAHDSTLISLMCAFRLDQPSEWPPYASYLQLEVLQCTNSPERECYVRFSLNGNILRSRWEHEDEAHSMIRLDDLVHNLETVGASKESFQQ